MVRRHNDVQHSGRLGPIWAYQDLLESISVIYIYIYAGSLTRLAEGVLGALLLAKGHGATVEDRNLAWPHIPKP